MASAYLGCNTQIIQTTVAFLSPGTSLPILLRASKPFSSTQVSVPHSFFSAIPCQSDKTVLGENSGSSAVSEILRPVCLAL